MRCSGELLHLLSSSCGITAPDNANAAAASQRNTDGGLVCLLCSLTSAGTSGFPPSQEMCARVLNHSLVVHCIKTSQSQKHSNVTIRYYFTSKRHHRTETCGLDE